MNSVHGLASGSASARLNNDHSVASEISYIGETARPFRERVAEHLRNLANGSTKSFIIAHWMEAHESSLEPPDFEWKVLESYGDALRRQLGEGLHILHSGVLNRKQEYNNNIICRMQVTKGKDDLSERDLQKELEKKKIYNNRLKSFIKNVIIDKKNNKAPVLDESNQLLCCRSDPPDQLVPSPVRKRKRSDMETSTPLHGRRETKMVDMEEDSSIENCDISSLYSPSDDKIADSKQKAGMSNEMDSVVMTPPKLVSPETMDRRLALHARDLVTASVNNPGLQEMQEQVMQTADMSKNPFAKRDDGRQVIDLIDPGENDNALEDRRHAAGVEGMDKASTEGQQAVGVIGMNKAPEKEPEEANFIRAVGMDEMNNSPIGGVGIIWRLWEVWMGLRERR